MFFNCYSHQIFSILKCFSRPWWQAILVLLARVTLAVVQARIGNVRYDLQGRLIDHLRNSESVGLEDLQLLVLDEADRLLELGFSLEVETSISNDCIAWLMSVQPSLIASPPVRSWRALSFLVQKPRCLVTWKLCTWLAYLYSTHRFTKIIVPFLTTRCAQIPHQKRSSEERCITTLSCYPKKHWWRPTVATVPVILWFYYALISRIFIYNVKNLLTSLNANWQDSSSLFYWEQEKQ